MNQSALIEKVAQATELNQAVVGQAVKAVVNAILDALVAGEAVRVSGLGSFDVAARPAREGRNPQTGEAIQIAASKAVRFHAGKAVKDALNPPTAKAAFSASFILLAGGQRHSRTPRCGIPPTCV
jgi:DNA-binding protein HU-beta